jgi:hypothetical protein
MKRSCRRTADENRIHDRAVRLRKMTDAQLVQYIEDRERKAREEAQAQPTVYEEKKGVQEFLDFILKTRVQGIGIVTADKLMRVAKENEFI